MSTIYSVRSDVFKLTHPHTSTLIHMHTCTDSTYAHTNAHLYTLTDVHSCTHTNQRTFDNRLLLFIGGPTTVPVQYSYAMNSQ